MNVLLLYLDYLYNQLIFKNSDNFLDPLYESEDILGLINPDNPDQYDMIAIM